MLILISFFIIILIIAWAVVTGTIDRFRKGKECREKTKELIKYLEVIERNPKNTSAHERFLLKSSEIPVVPHFIYDDSINVFEIFIRHLDKTSMDSASYDRFFNVLLKMKALPNTYSQIAYNKALEILEIYPESTNTKKLVLDIGRYYFAKLRAGRPTIYDEQAIQNDISVRLTS